MGHKTAKSFYNYLEKRNLECNYQYYVKIEKNIVTPSSHLINQIAKSLPMADAEILVQSYCQMQFEQFKYLFNHKNSENIIETNLKPIKKSKVLQGQKELTEAQVAVLALKKENYHLFLLITLARRSLTKKEITEYLNLSRGLKVLLEQKIILFQNETYSSASNEFLFPKAHNDNLKKHYELFDKWDSEFENNFELKKIVNKMMIRRISPRYLSLIQKQIELLMELIRTSDETDVEINDQVIQLQMNLSCGKIPG
jgi:hypothetical protein